MSFNIISYRQVHAIAVRPDSSSSYLMRFKGQGYTKVVFVANFGADPDCGHLDGNVYEIDDLLSYDDPLFRTSHINCVCSFEPLEDSMEVEEEEEPEAPIETQPAATAPTPQIGPPTNTAPVGV